MGYYVMGQFLKYFIECSLKPGAGVKLYRIEPRRYVVKNNGRLP